MDKVTSSIKQEKYKIVIKSPTGNIVIADEPIAMGGQDAGFSPKELLASALAACTSATVKIYADRKEWDLQEVNVNIALAYSKEENRTVINRKMNFVGNLDEKQKSQLLSVANACPMHKILSNPIEINSQVENNLM